MYAQITDTNRRRGRQTVSNTHGAIRRFAVTDRRHSGLLNHGAHSNSSIRQRQRRPQCTINHHNMATQSQHRDHPSTQVTALFLTHVDFAVTLTHRDVILPGSKHAVFSLRQNGPFGQSLS